MELYLVQHRAAMRVSRVRLVRGLTMALALLAVSGCTGGAEPPPPPVLPVTIHVVTASAPGSAITYSADIKPYTQVDVAFKVSGYVQALLKAPGVDGRPRDVQSGDRVTTNEVLATVREDTYRQKADEARSRLAVAQASLRDAESNLNRGIKLRGNGIIAESDFDGLRRRYDTSKAEVDGAEAALREADMNLAYCQLRSPIDGIVLARSVEVGTLVAPNTIGFQIADATSMKAVVGVPEQIVGSLVLGEGIAVTASGAPHAEFGGRITRIGSAADPKTRVFDVEVTIPNPDNRLRVGMIAALDLQRGAPAVARLLVPLNAVVRPPGETTGYAVYVVEDQATTSIARLRRVDVNDMVGNAVAISQGLAVGDRVVVRGANVVNDGEAVRVIP